MRFKAMADEGKLKFPVLNVNDAQMKHLFDSYGTGQITFDGLLHATNLLVAGKDLVVAGSVWGIFRSRWPRSWREGLGDDGAQSNSMRQKVAEVSTATLTSLNDFITLLPFASIAERILTGTQD